MNARPFFDTAREIRRGQFLDDCADALQECVAAVQEHGKPAKLVIEITVKPASRGQGAVVLADKVSAKLASLSAGETILFVTVENNLTATNPVQQALDLKSVPIIPVHLKNLGA